MDKIIRRLISIYVAIVCVGAGLVVYKMIDTIKCIFDSHKWKESENGMEWICERCGISCARCHNRQSQQRWFKFSAFLRSKMKRLKKLLTEPTEKYTEKGRKDPFYQPTKWTIFGRPIWRILEVLGVLILLITGCTTLIKRLS